MKKVLTLLLTFLILFTLAACGGGQQPTQDGQGTTPGGTGNIDLPAPSGGPAATDPAGTEGESGETPAGTETPGAGAGEPQYGGVVKMITTADTSYAFGLPWNSALNFATQVIVPFGECLVLETTSGDIKPWLATEWELDVENAEVRLKLREDVYFSDGSKFNADVVEWNFIKSKEAKALNPVIDRVEKRGEYEVAVICAGGNWANHILNLLASHSFAIVSQEHYETNGDAFAGEHPVGTGPFVMTEKNPGVSVLFEKNDSYWQPEKPYLDGFEFHAITDKMTQNAALMSNGADRVDVLNAAAAGSAEQLATLSQDPDLTVWAFPNGVTAIFPSSANPDSPFAKLEVRQAVSYAIDRQTIAVARGYGYLEPATQFLPEGYYGHYADDRDMFSYDPEKARELLAAAGYPDGFATNWTQVATMDQDLAVAVTDMLAQVGITCTLEFPEAGRMTEIRATGWEGMINIPFTALASIPSTFRLAIDPAGVYNVSTMRPEGYAADYDLLFTSETFDQGRVEKMQEHFLDNMMIIPIIEQVNSYVVRNNIQDAEYGFWAVGTQWLPSNMWLSE